MNAERINQIKEQIRSLMSEIISMGEEPPEFIQDLLLQVIEKSQNRINELYAEDQNQQGAPPSSPPPSNLENEPSADAQLLWYLSGQQEQAFISYLRDYPSPATRQLLNNPHELSRTIEYLNRMAPQGQPAVVDGVPHADLNSSNIWGTAYNPQTGQMKVRFQGGAEYEYDGVPANIYRAFSKGNASAKTKGRNEYGAWWVGKNPSLGAALNQYIKQGKFNYRRLR